MPSGPNDRDRQGQAARAVRPLDPGPATSRWVASVDIRAGHWAEQHARSLHGRGRTMTTTLDKPAAIDDAELELIDEYWRAANYLSVGQIYLLDNPLLHEPLRKEHTKPRLLGHWGTVPGLNFLYVHLNRIIKARDLDVIFITGPGHGAPVVVANTWLEGTCSELYPDVSQDAAGMCRLFRQFSFPGGIPSHTAPETP